MLKRIVPLLSCALMLSCAKPTAPESLTPGSGGYTVVAKVPISGYAQDVEVRDTVVYVAQGEGGLTVISMANPNVPSVLALCQGVRGYSYKLAVKDSMVYLAAGGFGLNTVGVVNPSVPTIGPNYGNAGNTYDVGLFGSWLLEAKGEWGVRFDDLSDPTTVDAKGRIEGPGYAHGMAFTADSCLLLTCGEMGLALYDLKDIGRVEGFYDPHTKFYAAWTDLPGYAVGVTTMGEQPIAFVACGAAGVQVVAFTDTSLSVIGAYSTGGYAKEVAYRSGRLYVTTELRGLQVLSVANPAAPQLVGVVGTKYALGLAVDQRYVYVADETEGLIVIAVPSY